VLPDDPAERETLVEGLAVLTLSTVDMFDSDTDVYKLLVTELHKRGVITPAEVCEIAAAISGVPQPPDEPADARQYRIPLEQYLGLKSTEQELLDALRAREILERIADAFAELQD
jgi:hypothetical protein